MKRSTVIEKEEKFVKTFYQYFRFPEGNKRFEVIEFLKNNPFLINVLLEAPNNIFRVFGKKDIALHLELHKDPEEDFEELFIIIKNSYDIKQALRLSTELGKRWFLDLPYQVREILNITEESI